jgi:hypothetical protein
MAAEERPKGPAENMRYISSILGERRNRLWRYVRCVWIVELFFLSSACYR